MTLDEYQEKATKTLQTYNSKDQENFYLGYLGLAGVRCDGLAGQWSVLVFKDK